MLSNPDTFVVATIVKCKELDGEKYCFSSSRTKTRPGSTNPIYNEEIHTSDFGKHSKLVLNVYSSHIMGSDTFIGQSTVHLDEWKGLADGKRRHRFELTLGKATEPVYDARGRLISPLQQPREIAGTLEIFLNVPSVYRNCCGWFFLITNTLTDVRGEKMWCVLKDSVVICYDSPYFNEVLKIIDLKRCTDIREKWFRLEIDVCGVELLFSGHGRSVELAWGEDKDSYKGIWLAAFKRHCPRAV